jgi:hypothetical protein
MLAGGLGAGALIALPDLSLAGRHAGQAPVSQIIPVAPAGQRYTLLYGTLPTGAPPGGLIAPAVSATSKAKSLPQAKALSVNLAATPVLSPDQASVALITISNVSGGAEVKLTLVESATAAVEKQGTLNVTGIPAGTSIIATPVFAAGTSTIAVVLGITEATDRRAAVKKGANNGAPIHFEAVTYVSHHALAYFDTRTGAFSGPFHLGNAPALALSTAAANSSDLIVWTTAEPQPSKKGTQPPLPTVSMYPLGSGTARLSVPSPVPWPGREPVVTLASGDVARLVYGKTVQVVSAQTGQVSQTTISALSTPTAKPSVVTMSARPDGTVFIVKAGLGRAVVADPANSFAVSAQVDFAVPGTPGGGPPSKAVLSASGQTLYVLGPAKTGGVAAYDVATGKLTGSYSKGTTYSGLYLLPSDNLLAISASNPRLTYFSPALEPIGTADTSLQVAAAF